MRIYLDHNATTPIRPQVAEAMSAVLHAEFGNPSSVYEEGAAARARVESARAQVAALLGADTSGIRFTAGATEANNTLLFGLLEPGDHVVTSAVEHPSISEPLGLLEGRGIRVTRVSPDGDGCLSSGAVLDAIGEGTRLVSIIWANNETGSLQPIEEICAECRRRGVLFHSDATQAVGKTAIDLARVPADFLSSSAHKLGGPKGVGALVARDNTALPAFLHGGGQERGLRGGTENVAGIVGYGLACELALVDCAQREESYGKLRDRLWMGIRASIENVRWNGNPARVLTNTLNVEFSGLAGEVLVQALDLEGVAVSAGAACHSGSIEPSKVLTAMGRTPEEARGSLRFSVGWGVDEAQIDRVVGLLAQMVPRVRAVDSP
ncbi:MAG: cysteine desulfurase [bacterium]|nr:cysteine desulfurase [Deltaproteobacteria bacterium]MCP4908390.1 cysteine desulfurase [bacterium]